MKATIRHKLTGDIFQSRIYRTFVYLVDDIEVIGRISREVFDDFFEVVSYN